MQALQMVVCAVLMVITSAKDRYHPDQTLRNPNGINNAERFADYWHDSAMSGIKKRLSEIQNNKIARNVILFIGDGLSVPTLAPARILKGQRQNRTGEETEMFFETFPTVGLSKTYCINQQIPDSGCTATAYLTGIKNNYGVIGLNGEVERHDCLASLDKSRHLESIAAWALAAGKDAGIVTNTRITHASPAGAYAKAANRHWETDGDVKEAGYDTDACPDIAHQLINMYPGNEFKVILGGGRREFLPNTTIDEEGDAGRRTDDRNLVHEWLNNKASRNVGHQYVWNRSQLMNLRNSPPEYLLGLFESDHIPYHLQADKMTEPTLTELTEVAINSLSRNEKGYFLFIESGRIDHAHHDNWPQLALDETLQLDLAVQKAVELVGDDTLIVVTADHSHVMAFNGFTARGTNILGHSDKIGDDNIPYMTLSYTNGPGARKYINGVRPDVTKDPDYMDLKWMAHAEVILDSETHGGDDVAVMAWGPHHHMFSGLYEQNQIPFRMAYAACIGPGLRAEACNDSTTQQPYVFIHAFSLIVLLCSF